jgi:hypothetical protein
MIILLFANKIKTDEPYRIFYAAAIEFLVLDCFVIGYLVRLFLIRN